MVVTVERVNLVIVGASQSVLGADDFNIVGHTRLETVARLRNFLLRQLHAQVGHVHLMLRRVKLRLRGFHLQRNLVAQIGTLLIHLLELQIGLGDLGVNPPSGKERHVHE